MGKFYLREVTRGYAKAKALASSSAKRLLLRRLWTLQRQFDAGDCAVQEELREHELWAALAADGPRKERFLLAFRWSKNTSQSRP